MGISALAADERVADVRFEDDRIVIDLMDGRTIEAPLAWFPRLMNATPAQRARWERAGGGYGLHWPDLDDRRPAPRRAGDGLMRPPSSAR